MSAAALELGDSVLVAKRPQNAAGRVSENSRLFVVSSPPRDYADHEEDNCDDDHDEEDNCDDVAMMLCTTKQLAKEGKSCK